MQTQTTEQNQQTLFRDRIIKLRKFYGYTQQEAADKIGVPRSTLANYERGGREPDIRNMAMLARFYKVSIDYLLGFEELYEGQHTEEELALIRRFESYSTDGQEKLLRIGESLGIK